ncbi:kazal-like serine protease inhibitor domain and phox-like domain-containing protein [Plasmopara halstedii]|uniref:Kazal-like serine protease inhibitor domain and phox-like domain-containing protein n=1 Tax=Plasmopara halstedii TaxID=4781 RepID=A0A0P1AHL4_PLAHL|nr:kazal-like serine protease inhibitor domain and phox-like domain-containing protein [Plasmopara halstedii]CEG40318.1 kazal-like serine protease inhibitor domain and phox-like domain-containing protein [Plasmopara halstedii]|eukprot:XP_024576687.1 kazal-like serine protease inhibitor domain and phox-like domain-containing protein [Plasmopara halstedii]
MTESSIQAQRLKRVHEKAKDSLSISTQVAPAGGVAANVTIYHMDISFRSTRNKWSIAKRYSDFYAVRQQLRKFTKQHNRQQCSNFSNLVPILALNKTLESVFPRRHFRSDNITIIAERRVALESFVQSLVKIVASIPMAIDLASDIESITTTEGKQLAELYAILRDFLEYPDKQIESEAKLTLAVLSLEDVVVNSRRNILAFDGRVCSNECCSICLSEWDDEDCGGMNVVKLPCEHAFHEECLLEWLQGSTHCPMCREEPKTLGLSTCTDESAAQHHDHGLKTYAEALTERHS